MVKIDRRAEKKKTRISSINSYLTIHSYNILQMHMLYTHIFRLSLFVAGARGKLIQMPAIFCLALTLSLRCCCCGS